MLCRGRLAGRADDFGSTERDGADAGLIGVLFSLSDKAKSCFMICTFSALLALAGPVPNSLIPVAHAARAVAPPMSAMLIVICAGWT